MNTQKPTKKKKSSLFILWLIPLIALGVALTTLYEHFKNRGVEVVVVLDSADGLKVDTTPLKYKGIEIGKVTGIDVNHNDIDKIDVTLTVDSEVADLIAREGTRFWKVQPNISLSGVSGLGTLLSGNYIACMTEGKSFTEIESQQEKTMFEALKEPPLEAENLGKVVNLYSEYGELSVGAPVLYNDFVVGKVVDQELVDTKVVYKISVDKKYASLLKKDSRFWRKSALDVKASLKGVELKVASLESALAGGIEFTSPKGSLEAEAGEKFTLYDDKKETTMSTKTVTIYASSGHNLKKGTSVYFNGVEAGLVRSVVHEGESRQVAIEIALYEMYKDEVNKSSYFWVVEPKFGLDGLGDLEAIFEGGYIAFVTQKPDEEWAESFTLHTKAPIPKGYEITLKPTGPISLKEGSGLYFNTHKVGEIVDVEFIKHSGKRVVKGVVYSRYQNLINNSSLFYINSGIIFEASLDGVYLQSGSLDDMIKGGVAFITPNKGRLSKKEFTLYSDYKSFKHAKYLSQDGSFYTLEAKSAKDIAKRMPIFYKDFKAGEVVDFEYDPKSDSVKVDVFIDKKYAENIDSSSRFYNISGLEVDAGLDGIKVKASPLSALINGGIAFENHMSGSKVGKNHIFKLESSDSETQKSGIALELYMGLKNGVKSGSKLLYRGMQVGEIQSVELQGDRIKAMALVDSEYEGLLRYDSVFYLDEFELGLGGVKNTDSILSGTSISIIKGSSNVKNYAFEISKKTPSMTLYEDGLRVLLKASRKSSLDIGSPLYYRQVKIGEIEDLRLSSDSKSVEFMVYIDECYSDIIRENSRFYQAGGIGFDIDLFGVKVETETVETLLKGGIIVATPNNLGVKPKDRASYKLYDNPKSEWLEWEPVIDRVVPECSM